MGLFPRLTRASRIRTAIVRRTNGGPWREARISYFVFFSFSLNFIPFSSEILLFKTRAFPSIYNKETFCIKATERILERVGFIERHASERLEIDIHGHPLLFAAVSMRRHRCQPIGALIDNNSPSPLIGLAQLTSSSYRRDSRFFLSLGKSHARQNGGSPRRRIFALLPLAANRYIYIPFDNSFQTFVFAFVFRISVARYRELEGKMSRDEQRKSNRRKDDATRAVEGLAETIFRR